MPVTGRVWPHPLPTQTAAESRGASLELADPPIVQLRSPTAATSASQPKSFHAADEPLSKAFNPLSLVELRGQVAKERQLEYLDLAVLYRREECLQSASSQIDSQPVGHTDDPPAPGLSYQEEQHKDFMCTFEGSVPGCAFPPALVALIRVSISQ